MQTIERNGNPLAYQLVSGTGPTIVFLPGYASDMSGSKAVAIDAWAREAGRSSLRFDYAGCGESGGAFEDQTLASWRDDALAGGWHLDQYAAKAAHEAAQQPPAPDVEDEPVTREALAAKAAALGIKFDGRWGDRRLAEAIAAAQG